MKVLHHSTLAAVVVIIAGVLLPSTPVLARDNDAPRVRVGREGARSVVAAAVEYAPPKEGTVEVKEGGSDQRSALAASSPCGQLSCEGPILHLCSPSMYFDYNWCENYSYNDVVAGGHAEICAWKVPMIMVLVRVQNCVGEIGSIKFDLFKDGVRLRRYTERQYPYTVFGDTTSPTPTVKSRVFGPGNYTMTVDIKDPNGCLILAQKYDFTSHSC